VASPQAPKYTAAIDCFLDERARLPEPSEGVTKGLQKVITAYCFNMIRVNKSIEILSHLVDVMHDWTRFELDSFLELNLTPITLAKQEDGQRLVDMTLQKLDEMRLNKENVDAKFRLVSANQLVDVFCNRMGPLYGWLGIESTYYAALVLTWTAFETLAGDLWVAAVNAAPHRLAELSGARERIESKVGIAPPPIEEKPPEPTVLNEDDDPNEDAEEVPGGIKWIKLSGLRRVTNNKYNLSNHMGDLLRSVCKFTSLSEIRASYSLAFSEKIKKKVRTFSIDAALSNRALDALSAVRNLIVHKAGRADQEYIDQQKDAPTAPGLELNKTLAVDGELVRSLVLPVIMCSKELITSVNNWVKATKPDDEKPDANKPGN
jgi:hypothetical protein